MRSPNTPPSGPKAGSAQRRGIAMLLVLIALFVSTVLAGAALTSRDNSPTIGVNVTNATAAHWACSSASNVAIAAIEQGIEWSSVGTDVMSDVTMGDAVVDVVATDLDGNAPTADTRELIVTVSAEVGGVTVTSERRVSLYPELDPEDAIDPELKEFAIFATEEIYIHPGSKIKIWDESPEAGSGAPIKLGTGFASSASLTFPSNPEWYVKLFVDSNASSSLQARVADPSFDGGMTFSYAVPALENGIPEAFDTLIELNADLDFGSADTETVGSVGWYDDIELANGAVITLDANSIGTSYGCDSLIIDGGSVLRIVGEVDLVVRDEVRVLNSSRIEIGTDAVLNLYFGGRVELDNGKIASAFSGYMSPEAINIFGAQSIPEAPGTTPEVRIQNAGVFMGCLHVPTGEIVVESGSVIYGRVSAARFELGAGTRLEYCPTLDMRCGFTEPQGSLYDQNGVTVLDLDTLFATMPEDDASFDDWKRDMYEMIADDSAKVVEETANVEDGGGGTVEETTTIVLKGAEPIDPIEPTEEDPVEDAEVASRSAPSRAAVDVRPAQARTLEEGT
ncbi:MAG: hypothetical protein AAFX05_03670 [Planctomycetota bacterium]